MVLVVVPDVQRQRIERGVGTGGEDDGMMEEINMAYHILVDDEKRKVYDETGYYETQHMPTVEEEALSMLAGVLQGTANHFGKWFPYIDIVGELTDSINDQRKRCKADRSTAATTSKLLKSVVQRIKTKTGDNLLGEMIGNIVIGHEQTIERADRFLAVTDKILEILDHYGVHATFFMLGTQVKRNPSLASRVATGGNLIGNHTLGHKDLSKQKPAEIKRQIDFLARWKGNQYYFYSELSIELKGYPLINPGARYTQEQVREIIRYARERHVDVVPCLEFYGHLHDLFRIERYGDLAALPHGGDLNPRDPRMQRMVEDWVGQMAALFPSPWFHIGLDEPWELERAGSAAALS